MGTEQTLGVVRLQGREFSLVLGQKLAQVAGPHGSQELGPTSFAGLIPPACGGGAAAPAGRPARRGINPFGGLSDDDDDAPRYSGRVQFAASLSCLLPPGVDLSSQPLVFPPPPPAAAAPAPAPAAAAAAAGSPPGKRCANCGGGGGTWLANPRGAGVLCAECHIYQHRHSGMPRPRELWRQPAQAQAQAQQQQQGAAQQGRPQGAAAQPPRPPPPQQRQQTQQAKRPRVEQPRGSAAAAAPPGPAAAGAGVVSPLQRESGCWTGGASAGAHIRSDSPFAAPAAQAAAPPAGGQRGQESAQQPPQSAQPLPQPPPQQQQAAAAPQQVAARPRFRVTKIRIKPPQPPAGAQGAPEAAAAAGAAGAPQARRGEGLGSILARVEGMGATGSRVLLSPIPSTWARDVLESAGGAGAPPARGARAPSPPREQRPGAGASPRAEAVAGRRKRSAERGDEPPAATARKQARSASPASPDMPTPDAEDAAAHGTHRSGGSSSPGSPGQPRLQRQAAAAAPALAAAGSPAACGAGSPGGPGGGGGALLADVAGPLAAAVAAAASGAELAPHSSYPSLQADAKRLRDLAMLKRGPDGRHTHVSLMFLAQSALRLLAIAAAGLSWGRPPHKVAGAWAKVTKMCDYVASTAASAAGPAAIVGALRLLCERLAAVARVRGAHCGAAAAGGAAQAQQLVAALSALQASGERLRGFQAGAAAAGDAQGLRVAAAAALLGGDGGLGSPAALLALAREAVDAVVKMQS
eukprot:scaffold2.g6948.t1